MLLCALRVLSLPGSTSVHRPQDKTSHGICLDLPSTVGAHRGVREALAGVSFRTGNVIDFGRRVLSGLVASLGSFSIVIDTTGCFSSKPLPTNGCLIRFGALDVYVATEIACSYPEQVLVAKDPPSVCAVRGQRSTRPVSCAEVMMAGSTAGAGKSAAGKGEAGKTAAKIVRSAKPVLEKPGSKDRDQAGTSEMPIRPSPLEVVIEKLAMPVVTGADPALAQAELEQQREELHREALAMDKMRKEFDRDLREYHGAHGFTPISRRPSRIDAVRQRGKGLGAEIDRDGRSATSRTASHVSAVKPQYSSPAKTLKAAEIARQELSSMTREAKQRQQDRVNELVSLA